MQIDSNDAFYPVRDSIDCGARSELPVAAFFMYLLLINCQLINGWPAGMLVPTANDCFKKYIYIVRSQTLTGFESDQIIRSKMHEEPMQGSDVLSPVKTSLICIL